MDEQPALKQKLTRLRNTLVVSGVGLLALTFVALVFSSSDPDWPLNSLTFVLTLIAVAGVVMLFCANRIVRILMGFGNVEAPPITLNRPGK